MNMQIERRQTERRQGDPKSDDDLSPEYLALLEVCGGEIRASDKAALAERRRAAEAEAAQPDEKDKKAEAPGTALAPADRRRAGSA